MTFRFRSALGVGFVAVFGVSCAFAQVAVKPAEAPSDQKVEAKPAQKGATVFIDPVTHQVRQPSAAEIGDLTKQAAQATKASEAVAPAPTMIYPAGGGVGMVLDGSTDSYMVVRKGSDGKLDMECVTGANVATDRVANPKPLVLKPAAAAPKKEVLDVK
jgi:hypothetical protein